MVAATPCNTPCLCHVCDIPAGLLANLTCIRAELYEMEEALSVREDPLWVVPYSTTADEYTDLLQDFEAYAQVDQNTSNTVESGGLQQATVLRQ